MTSLPPHPDRCYNMSSPHGIVLYIYQNKVFLIYGLEQLQGLNATGVVPGISRQRQLDHRLDVTRWSR